jgi:glutathione S-transferase
MPVNLRIVGRSSSSFTRIARIFAAELGVPYELRVVRDLLSTNPDDYAGNPALKLPVLESPDGTWFGALNICRQLALASEQPRSVLWPEALRGSRLVNAQELTLHALGTEVALVMSQLGGAGGSAHQNKLRQSLLNVLAWLEQHVSTIRAELPAERDLSYLEVALFCLVTHLEFRDVLPLAPYPNLAAFCRTFAERPSARDTPYVFDP